jgi:hypothetical protein
MLCPLITDAAVSRPERTRANLIERVAPYDAAIASKAVAGSVGTVRM